MLHTELAATRAEIAGVPTRFFDSGSGTPLLLIHGSDFGSGGAAELWRWNIPDLSRSTRIIAPDRLGQGFTDGPRTTAEYRIDSVCDHLAALLDALELRSVVLVGQSRGAFVACRLAMRRPDLAASLILVNSASLAPAYGSYHAPARTNLRPGGANIRHNMEWLCRRTTHISDDWYRHVGEMLDRQGLRTVRDEFSIESSNYYADFDQAKSQTLEWLKSFHKPTTLVWGTDDHMTKPDDAIQCYSLLSGKGNNARLHMLDGCGHMPFLESPQEFNALVEQHLARTV